MAIHASEGRLYFNQIQDFVNEIRRLGQKTIYCEFGLLSKADSKDRSNYVIVTFVEDYIYWSEKEESSC